MKNIYVKFECGMEDRESKEYGPFEWVQLTYRYIRIPPNGDHFAQYDDRASEWWIDPDESKIGDPEDVKQWWSDVIIYCKEVQG